MSRTSGYKSMPLSFNRRVVIASATVTKDKNVIHCLNEVDITVPRTFIKEHFDKTGEKLSFTAYIVTCLAGVIKDYPQFNSFIKGSRLILLNDITISVLIEREIAGETVPEPVAIRHAQEKTYLQISREIRDAKKTQTDHLGSLSGATRIRFIPVFLLKMFVRIADKNIPMAERYGKIAVTAVGMYSKEPFWFIPHGTATVLVTIGSIEKKTVEVDGQFESREHLCLTISFDHDIIDGAPAARFVNQFSETIKSGQLLKKLESS